jgi:hypothetical protein
MNYLRDIAMWWFFWVFILTGAARAAFDGAFFAYFRPQWEAMKDSLPEFIQWMI